MTTSKHTLTPIESPSTWFWVLTIMIFIMAVIGAITRLTESGLSIMEWAPWSGFLPPLSVTEWERLLELYKLTDEYRLQWQAAMTMTDFQNIFWWEWIHRVWGRLIGLMAIASLLWSVILAFRSRVPWNIPLHFFFIGLGTAAQGALGWFMVASGFDDGLTDVSSVRLAMHLSAALLLFAYSLVMALKTSAQGKQSSEILLPANALWTMRWMVSGHLLLLSITIISGALVAGGNAAIGYNSWPLMNGELVPTAYDSGMPLLQNWIENNAAIQFNHRFLASICLSFAVILTIAILIILKKSGPSPRIRRAAHSVGGWVVLQYALGVITIFLSAYGVPVIIGALHQAGALVLLGLSIWLLYSLYSATSTIKAAENVNTNETV